MAKAKKAVMWKLAISSSPKRLMRKEIGVVKAVVGKSREKRSVQELETKKKENH